MFFTSTVDLTSQLFVSLVSSTPQGDSNCSGGVLPKSHSWNTCIPHLHLVAQLRPAAVAFPSQLLVRDETWGLVCCCCFQLANPAQGQPVCFIAV